MFEYYYTKLGYCYSVVYLHLSSSCHVAQRPLIILLLSLILYVLQNLRTAPQSKDQSLTRGDWAILFFLCFFFKLVRNTCSLYSCQKLKAPSTRIRFRLKTQLFSPFSKKFPSTRSVFRSFSSIHTKTLNRFENADTAYGACAFTSKMSQQESKDDTWCHFWVIFL